jgi:hypothetical protein
MRAAVPLAALLSLVGSVPAAAVEAASAGATSHRGNTAPPLRVPQRLAQALVGGGFPVRHPCGSVLEGPRVSSTNGDVVQLNSVPACWIVIYKDRFSVSITPHSSPAAARLAYERSYNKWARTTRRIAIGRLLLSGFRVPAHAWNVIRLIVSDIALSPR